MLLFLSVGGSGGISLKPSPSMDAMRADMGGAATVCASVITAAALKLPINIIGGFCDSGSSSPLIDVYVFKYFSSLHLFFLLIPGLAPLCENMPSGKATKPGDVVTAKNGKTIQVANQLLRCEAVRVCRERQMCLCVG